MICFTQGKMEPCCLCYILNLEKTVDQIYEHLMTLALVLSDKSSYFPYNIITAYLGILVTYIIFHEILS